MGGVPSRETLTREIVRVPNYGQRHDIVLLPLIRDFFPSADCPLFMQLYESRCDPAVRYNHSGDDDDVPGEEWRIDRIPPLRSTPQQLYDFYVTKLSEKTLYETDAELASAYKRGEYAGNNVPCAIAFVGGRVYTSSGAKYDNSAQFSEYVDVKGYYMRIGGVYGDIATSEEGIKPTPCDGDGGFGVITEDNAYPWQHQMFLTKSAGDHNRIHAMLASAYMYSYQWSKLATATGMGAIKNRPPTRGMKIRVRRCNVSALCFTREVRTLLFLLNIPYGPSLMWLDRDSDEIIHMLNTSAGVRCIIEVLHTFIHSTDSPETKAARIAARLDRTIEIDGGTKRISANVAVRRWPVDGNVSLVKRPFSVAWIVSDDAECVASAAALVQRYAPEKVDKVVPGCTIALRTALGPNATTDATNEEDDDEEEGSHDGSDSDSENCTSGERRKSTKTGSSADAKSAPAADEQDDDPNDDSWIREKFLVGSIAIEELFLAEVRDECKRAREAEPDHPQWVRYSDEAGRKEDAPDGRPLSDEEKRSACIADIVQDSGFCLWRISTCFDGAVRIVGVAPYFLKTQKQRKSNKKKKNRKLDLNRANQRSTSGSSASRAGAGWRNGRNSPQGYHAQTTPRSVSHGSRSASFSNGNAGMVPGIVVGAGDGSSSFGTSPPNGGVLAHSTGDQAMAMAYGSAPGYSPQYQQPQLGSPQRTSPQRFANSPPLSQPLLQPQQVNQQSPSSVWRTSPQLSNSHPADPRSPPSGVTAHNPYQQQFRVPSPVSGTFQPPFDQHQQFQMPHTSPPLSPYSRSPMAHQRGSLGDAGAGVGGMGSGVHNSHGMPLSPHLQQQQQQQWVPNSHTPPTHSPVGMGHSPTSMQGYNPNTSAGWQPRGNHPGDGEYDDEDGGALMMRQVTMPPPQSDKDLNARTPANTGSAPQISPIALAGGMTTMGGTDNSSGQYYPLSNGYQSPTASAQNRPNAQSPLSGSSPTRGSPNKRTVVVHSRTTSQGGRSFYVHDPYKSAEQSTTSNYADLAMCQSVGNEDGSVVSDFGNDSMTRNSRTSPALYQNPSFDGTPAVHVRVAQHRNQQHHQHHLPPQQSMEHQRMVNSGAMSNQQQVPQPQYYSGGADPYHARNRSGGFGYM